MAKKYLGTTPTLSLDLATKGYIDALLPDTNVTYSTLIGNGSATTFNINHNLNSLEIIVQVWDISTTPNELVLANISVVTADTVRISDITPTPSVNQYRVVAIAGRAVGTGESTSADVNDLRAYVDSELNQKLDTAVAATTYAPVTRRSNRPVGQDDLVINVKDYGATGNGVTDDTAAIQAAIAACSSGSVLLFPGKTTANPTGVYKITSTLVFPGAVKVTGGGSPANGAVILAGTTGMTMATYKSGTVIEDIRFNGNGVAAVGLKATYILNKAFIYRVRIENCTKWGFAYDGTQNSLTIDCLAQYNRINYAIFNGTANCLFINCQGNNTNQTYGTDARSVLIASNTTDPDLGGTVFVGNRNLTFIGGIYERIESGEYHIDVLNAMGQITFISTELSAAAVASLHVGPQATARVTLQGTNWSLNGGTEICGVIEGGEVHLGPGQVYTGLGGKNTFDLFAVSNGAIVTRQPSGANQGYEVLGPRETRFDTGISGWVSSNGGVMTYDSTKRRMVVTGNTTSQGVRHHWVDGARPGLQHRMLRVETNILGLTATSNGPGVWLNAEIMNSRRQIARLGPGRTVTEFELQGDEIGFSFTAGQNEATTWEMPYVNANLI